MNLIFLLFKFILILCMFAINSGYANQKPKILMSYWSVSNFKNQTLSFSALKNKIEFLDILAYAFLKVKSTGQVDLENNTESLFIFSKTQNHSRKLNKIISIGGANDKQSLKYAMLYPRVFARSISKLLVQYHLNGIDLDFEPTLFTPLLTKQYVNLITTLRTTLGPNRILSIAIAPDQTIQHLAWKQISANVNYISDMCYDFHTPFTNRRITGHNSNLYPDITEPMLSEYYHISCDESLRRLTFLGVPTQKILLGFPAYGLAYGSVSNQHNGLFQNFDPNKTPLLDPKNKDLGRVSYHKILQLLKIGFQEYTQNYNNHTNAVWAYNFKTQQFLSYDNLDVVEEKAKYVRQFYLAGLMMWSLQDDVPASNPGSLIIRARKNLDQ